MISSHRAPRAISRWSSSRAFGGSRKPAPINPRARKSRSDPGNPYICRSTGPAPVREASTTGDLASQFLQVRYQPRGDVPYPEARDGRVDLVAEHHHAAHAPQPGARRGHERGQDIGGPVRPGQARVTHRPGDHDRRVRGVHQVQQESRLLDRVGALDHHRARRPRGNLTRDRAGQIQQVLDGEGGTRQASEVVNCYLGTDPAQTGHRGEQVRRGERGHSRYRFAPAHR